MYRGLGGFKGLSSERTWVYRIAKNKLGDYYRRQYKSAFERAQAQDTELEALEDPEQDVQLLHSGSDAEECLLIGTG